MNHTPTKEQQDAALAYAALTGNDLSRVVRATQEALEQFADIDESPNETCMRILAAALLAARRDSERLVDWLEGMEISRVIPHPPSILWRWDIRVSTHDAGHRLGNSLRQAIDAAQAAQGKVAT